MFGKIFSVMILIMTAIPSKLRTVNQSSFFPLVSSESATTLFSVPFSRSISFQSYFNNLHRDGDLVSPSHHHLLLLNPQKEKKTKKNGCPDLSFKTALSVQGNIQWKYTRSPSPFPLYDGKFVLQFSSMIRFPRDANKQKKSLLASLSIVYKAWTAVNQFLDAPSIDIVVQWEPRGNRMDITVSTEKERLQKCHFASTLEKYIEPLI